MRRALLILGIMIVLIGIGVFLYFYFFTNTSGITVAPNGSVNFPSAGNGTFPSGGNTTTTSSGPVVAPVVVSARLVKISAGPVVVGECVVNVPAINASSSPETVVNYIERQSGNVFSYHTHAGTITRTNNQTVPGIESATWLPDASFAFVRYLSGTDFSTINTYALPSSGSGGFFLAQNIADVAVSSVGIVTLASGVNGSVASLSHIDGTHSSQVFTTPLSAIHTSFLGKSQYMAYTKPSASLPGYAFLVNSTGYFSRVVGPLNGLVALASPSGKWLLVSSTLNSAMQMELLNTATNEAVPLPVATIADKCVWTDDGSTIYCGIPVDPSSDYAYPDDWYQGVVHFSDRIWKIDVAGRYAQLVLDFPSETKGTLDAEALAVDSLNTDLVFVNKNDGSLWNYQL